MGNVSWLNFTAIFLGYVVIVSGSAATGHEWTYRGGLGPNHWHLDYPHCGGVKQSPISVVTDDVIVDTTWLTPFHFTGYDSVAHTNMTLENNGHTVQVNLNHHGVEITGGGLGATYVAEQFHFHWGAVDARGSEHDINGKHFPMEMHIVHFAKEHGTLGEAADKEDGLAVLGFFFVVGRHNGHFEAIIQNFLRIMHTGETVISPIPLRELIPAHLGKYYRYSGSLTTPPCYESVIWTLFNETIEIAEEQLEDFRTKIFGGNEQDLRDVSDDFRPVQCMHHRKVYASQQTLKYNSQPSQSYAQTQDGSPGAAGRVSFKIITVLICLFVVFIANSV